MIGAVLAGLLARWHDLEVRPLAVDEYYTVRSVEFVLERGLPEFPSGGLYTRGLPLNTSGRIDQDLRRECVRLSSARPGLQPDQRGPGLLVRPPLHHRPGCRGARDRMLVSSWHIEFALFVRMYALFQCLTLLFLIAVDDAYFGTGWRRRYVPHALLVLATLAHQLGLLLTRRSCSCRWSSRIPGFWTLGGSGFYRGRCADLSRLPMFERSVSGLLSVVDRYPSDYQPVDDSGLRAPAFPFWRLDGDPWTTLFLVVSLIALTLAALAAQTPGAVDRRQRRLAVDPGHFQCRPSACAGRDRFPDPAVAL